MGLDRVPLPSSLMARSRRPKRAAYREGHGDDCGQQQGNQQGGLPQHAPSGGLCSQLQRGYFRVDLCITQLAHLCSECRQLAEPLGQVTEVRRATRHGHDTKTYRSLLLP